MLLSYTCTDERLKPAEDRALRALKEVQDCVECANAGVRQPHPGRGQGQEHRMGMGPSTDRGMGVGRGRGMGR